jgi:outer membrane murein-binding lipoprotein Lpp
VRRTTITLIAAAAGVAVLAGCGGPVRMGSAAITGSHSISAATLSSEVSNLSSTYKAAKGKIQLQFPPSQVPQQVLSWLVRFRIRDQLAVRSGVSVTPAQIQRALDSVRAQARQSGTASLADLAVANGLPPDMLPGLGRYQAIETAVINQLDGGTLPKSNAALQQLGSQFNKQQCLAAKSLHISINPQYGQLDYKQLAVVPATSTLSAPEVVKPSASPSPSAQTAPPC